MSVICSTTFSTVQAMFAHLASGLRMRSMVTSSGALVAAALLEGGRETHCYCGLVITHTHLAVITQLIDCIESVALSVKNCLI
jgi:hypothetical protein